MKQPRLFRILSLILAGLSVACTATITPSAVPTTTITDQPQLNFAFYFEYGSCLIETFDAFNGAFTHDMGPYEPAITIPLELTDEQMEAIYQRSFPYRQ